MAFKVFIDGEAGTTGLQIRDRLQSRPDLTVVSIDSAYRKNRAARADALNSADIAILCLPDEAAKEALSLVSHDNVRIIDTSTAHRVAQGWTYGFAEMERGQRDAIASSARVANPGCFAIGAIAALRPIIKAGLLTPEFPIAISAISGYSGGGRALIADFEQTASSGGTFDAFRVYGLSLTHKHVPEIQKYSELTYPPVFMPSVGRYAQGMVLEIPLQLWALPNNTTSASLHETLADAYSGSQFIDVVSEKDASRLQEARRNASGYIPALDPENLNGTNRMRIFVFSNDEQQQVRLIIMLDNLGKGASGSAVQNLNLMLGLDEGMGL